MRVIVKISLHTFLDLCVKMSSLCGGRGLGYNGELLTMRKMALLASLLRMLIRFSDPSAFKTTFGLEFDGFSKF